MSTPVPCREVPLIFSQLREDSTYYCVRLRGKWAVQRWRTLPRLGVSGLESGAAYQNRTDDLLITSEDVWGYRPLPSAAMAAHEGSVYLETTAEQVVGAAT